MLTPYAASKFYRQYLAKTESMAPPAALYAALHRYWRLDVRQESSAWAGSEQPYPWFGQGATPGGYARQLLTPTVPSDGEFSNASAMTWGPATTNRWAPSIATALYDAVTGGNMLAWAPVRMKLAGGLEAVHDMSLPVGDSMRMPAGGLTFDMGARGDTPFDMGEVSNCIGWWWAGRGATNLRIEKKPSTSVDFLLKTCFDLSGNGNDITGFSGGEPGIREGITVPDTSKRGVFQTMHYTIGVHEFESGGGHTSNRYVFDTPLSLTGPFCLVSAQTNYRGTTGGGANRELWGHGDLNNYITWHQGNGTLTAVFGGVSKTISTQLPELGFFVLEIERDNSGIIHVRVNGQDVTSGGGVSHPTTFTCAGFGYKGSGSSQWDDYLFEIAAYDRALTSAEITQINTHLREKWYLNFLERPRWAGLSDWGANQLALWLTGTSISRPAQWYAALLHRDPSPGDTGSTIDEADYTGYARKTIFFTTDQNEDGRGANQFSMNFANPTSEPKAPFGSIAIVDALTPGTGNVVAFIPLEDPRIRKAGSGTIDIRAESLALNVGSVVN